MKRINLLLISFIQLAWISSVAQPATVTAAGNATDNNADSKQAQQSVTYGAVATANGNINYKAVAGTIILKNARDIPTASIFYTAYFKEGEKNDAQRPLTFLYNGGPGSSTVWLHMGAFGPQRVSLDDSVRTGAPYKTVNNDYTLLDVSDLVFIDAPATGFSRLITKEMGGDGQPENFFGSDPDANAFADFIVQFLSQYNRWNSPKYLFGESYGTFRSALLADVLESGKGVGLNGVILLSQILNLANSADNPHAEPGANLPYQLVLPSYAAVAWYHHQLPHQPEKLEPFLKEVEHFAMNEYALALQQGAMLDAASFDQVAQKLHEYTGLSMDYIKKANLRIEDQQFAHELLSKEGKITGRLDARYSGYAINRLAENIEYDPMDSYIDAAYVATFNTYVRKVLKYGTGQTFHAGGAGVYDQWDYRHKVPGALDPQANIFPNAMTALAHAMIIDPKLKVMLNSGYFDIGTPYYEGIYEMHHLPIPAALQQNITYKQYTSGHMVYLNYASLQLLHDNVAAFINGTH